VAAIHVICVMRVPVRPRIIGRRSDLRKGAVMDYTERLRRMANNDATVAAEYFDEIGTEPKELDPKTLALVRIGALVAVNGAVPSFGAHADAAVNAGATVDEIVAVLFGVLPIVGLPRVVAAAPRLAMALGYDTEDADASRQLG
jgi:4-carboxymuconolactone decarboxylase